MSRRGKSKLSEGISKIREKEKEHGHSFLGAISRIAGTEEEHVREDYRRETGEDPDPQKNVPSKSDMDADEFVASVLEHWLENHGSIDEFAQRLEEIIDKAEQRSSGNRRQRGRQERRQQEEESSQSNSKDLPDDELLDEMM